jgi:hypothetical protein
VVEGGVAGTGEGEEGRKARVGSGGESEEEVVLERLSQVAEGEGEWAVEDGVARVGEAVQGDEELRDCSHELLPADHSQVVGEHDAEGGEVEFD